MASKHVHAEKARHNEAALGRFNFEPDRYDWYITISFYAAVHWIRVYLSDAGRGIGKDDDIYYDDFPHLVREIYRARHSGEIEPAEQALNAFQIIKSLSKRSRYRCENPGWYARHTGDADNALSLVSKFVLGEVKNI